MQTKYETLDFYLETAKRAIGKWGHINMLKSEDDISHVAYMIMLADQKFDGRGTIEGFRMSYAKFGIKRLFSAYKKNSKRIIRPLDLRNEFGQSLYDFIPDGGLAIEDQIEIRDTEYLVNNFSFLTEREKSLIIRNRLNKETLELIGEDLGLTRERIRQIVDTGLAKLKRYYKSKS